MSEQKQERLPQEITAGSTIEWTEPDGRKYRGRVKMWCGELVVYTDTSRFVPLYDIEDRHPVPVTPDPFPFHK